MSLKAGDIVMLNPDTMYALMKSNNQIVVNKEYKISEITDPPTGPFYYVEDDNGNIINRYLEKDLILVDKLEKLLENTINAYERLLSNSC